ncbi:MAG: chorismate-binding protein [Chloroflexi bacterium]|nr:chorismate-binding protein [Chloroflexota bacterium]
MVTQSVVRSKSIRADVKQTNSHRIAAFYQAALANRLPVALWRQPRGRSYQAIVDLTSEPQPAAIDFHDNRPMFVFSPFVKEQNSATLCLQADLHLNATGLHSYRAANYTVRQVEHHRRFLQTYQDLLRRELKAQPSWYTLPFAVQRNMMATEAEFSALVKSAIDFIRAIQIRKVVVSRMMETPLPANFDPLVTFEQLCNRYPHAFVSLVAIPDVGTWMGASPELLLALDHEQLSTMALAGTQAHPTNQPLNLVQWGHKEVEEQALVSDYIRSFFYKAGITDLQEVGPETTAAGNVVHLRTTFQVKRPQEEILTLANQVLHQLHPTSAVCGMPKDKALSFILAHEQYDRSFYSGFLGPVHIGGQSSLYVNLRCMQLQKQTANLYIGAGITGESQPAAEWRETALKSETLLNVLHTTNTQTAKHAALVSRYATRES